MVDEPSAQRAQVLRLLNLLQECAPYFERAAVGIFDAEDIRRANFTARMLYLVTISSFKDEFFKDEREVRLLCQTTLSSPAVKFRASTYGLLPYFELTPEKGETPSDLVEGINIGPNVIDAVAADLGTERGAGEVRLE